LKNLKKDLKKDAAPFLPQPYNYGQEFEIAMGEQRRCFSHLLLVKEMIFKAS